MNFILSLATLALATTAQAEPATWVKAVECEGGKLVLDRDANDSQRFQLVSKDAHFIQSRIASLGGARRDLYDRNNQLVEGIPALGSSLYEEATLVIRGGVATSEGISFFSGVLPLVVQSAESLTLYTQGSNGEMSGPKQEWNFGNCRFL